MESTFRIGDRVRIRTNSQYYNESVPRHSDNPHDLTGIIIQVDRIGSGHGIRVVWDNERTNTYSVDDLRLAEGDEIPNTYIPVDAPNREERA